VAEIARRIKRYFINEAKSFASCSLHPYSFRWVTVAMSYGGCLGPRLIQFTFRNLIFPDDLVVFEKGNKPWSRFGSSRFWMLPGAIDMGSSVRGALSRLTIESHTGHSSSGGLRALLLHERVNNFRCKGIGEQTADDALRDIERKSRQAPPAQRHSVLVSE
jgi:hypothetical protein